MSELLRFKTTEDRSRWKEALAVSTTLSLLFVVVYKTSQWLASHRSGVGVWYYEWERAIPFVPAMIVPYMSLDLFFIAAPFLCSSRGELHLLARRIAWTIAIAGVCFLLFPLTLAVERPHVEGWLGAIYNPFVAFDIPYNMCPSLHIAFRTILAKHYGRHSRGPLRWLSHLWFCLIGVSTLLTHQHHIIDVVGGFVLAIVCFHLVRTHPLRRSAVRNGTLAVRYAIAAVALAGTGSWIGSWALLLYWPALSLGLVSLGYCGLGADVYGKVNGRLPWSSRLALGPALIGHWLSLQHYRRGCLAFDVVADRLWIGRRLNLTEAKVAIQIGVVAVLDLTAEFSEAASFRSVVYRNIAIQDLTAPTLAELNAAVEFIRVQTQRGIVYVHCKIGYSRSAAVVGAWLLASGECKSANEAIERLHTVRPTIVIRPEAESAIRQYATLLTVRVDDEDEGEAANEMIGSGGLRAETPLHHFEIVAARPAVLFPE